MPSGEIAYGNRHEDGRGNLKNRKGDANFQAGTKESSGLDFWTNTWIRQQPRKGDYGD